MRRMSEITGEPLEGEMEEAVRRLELGEDPDKIEAELGDVLGDDMGMGGPGFGPPPTMKACTPCSLDPIEDVGVGSARSRPQSDA